VSRFQLLTDAQWALIADLLPGRTGREGRPFSDARSMVEGIIYRHRAGIAWRDLPGTFGPWQMVWAWHRRLAGEGAWVSSWTGWSPRRTLLAWWIGRCRWTPRSPVRISTRRTSPALQGASSNYTKAGVEPPDHGFGRSRGGLSTKVHQLADGNGLPLVTAIAPGQSGDSPMLMPLLGCLRVARPIGRPRTRPDRVRGDKAYSSRAIRQHLRDRGIESVIPEPRDQQGHRKRRGSRGGHPVSYDPVDYRNRNVIERGFCRLNQWRGLATQYDKLAIVYRAAVVLNAAIAWPRQSQDTP